MNFFRDFTVENLLFIPAAIFAVMIHEICHGLAAYKLGDQTAKNMGRLSFNPIKHVDIFGLLMLIFVGFGWAKPVPVDIRFFSKPKRDMAIVALAGPVSNFAAAFFSLVIMRLFGIYYENGEFYVFNDIAQLAYWLGLFFFYCAMINIGLGVFNLFPIPPLDGSKIVGSFLPDRAYIQLMRFERYGMLVLMAVLWIGWLDPVLSSLRNGVLNGLYNIIPFG